MGAKLIKENGHEDICGDTSSCIILSSTFERQDGILCENCGAEEGSNARPTLPICALLQTGIGQIAS